MNPFDALGLPARPDLTDEQVRDAWRKVAAATHPDRADGGDLARYTQASAAFAQLRDPWSRSEAYADVMEGQPDTTPLPPVPPGFETYRPPPGYRPFPSQGTGTAVPLDRAFGLKVPALAW